MLPRAWLQRLLIGGLLVALLLAVVRILSVQGFFFPARIVSGSMAERLVGEHFRVFCRDCGFPFRFGVESPPPDERPVCPNCGFDRNEVQPGLRERGQRVLIDRGAYWLQLPRRFDVVSFADPERPSRLIVKRIVGLPGEQLAIRRGELFRDEKMIRKTLAQFRQSAVIVHDNAYLPQRTRNLPARWRTESADSGWQTHENGFRYTPKPQATGATQEDPTSHAADWLVYHHWRCYANPYPRSAEAPVSDNSGYNQGESRSLQNVLDLILRCRVTSQGAGRFGVRVHDGYQWFTLWGEPSGRIATIVDGRQRLASAKFPEESDPSSFEMEFGVLDRQLVFAVDRQQLLTHPLELSANRPEPEPRPLALVGDSLPLTIGELTIRRDVYYLDPHNVGQRWEVSRLAAADEYLVLGDNPSLSEDSRHWAEHFIHRDAIRGRVLPLPW